MTRNFVFISEIATANQAAGEQFDIKELSDEPDGIGSGSFLESWSGFRISGFRGKGLEV